MWHFYLKSPFFFSQSEAFILSIDQSEASIFLLWMYCEWRQECNAMVHWSLHGPTGPHSLGPHTMGDVKHLLVRHVEKTLYRKLQTWKHCIGNCKQDEKTTQTTATTVIRPHRIQCNAMQWKTSSVSLIQDIYSKTNWWVKNNNNNADPPAILPLIWTQLC